MTHDEFNPLFPDPSPGYPKAPERPALPAPAPLGPITTPLPRASSCWYTNLVCPTADSAFAIAARAPVGSTIVHVILAPTDAFLSNTFRWSIRGHSSLPNTRAQFESGPLILPTHINNPGSDDYADVPHYMSHLSIPLNIRLPQGAPLIILGLLNTGLENEMLNLHLIIDPPHHGQP